MKKDISTLSILPEDHFLLLVQSTGLDAYAIQSAEAPSIALTMSEQEFVNFAKSKNEIIFYLYRYLPESKVLITADTFDASNSLLSNLIFDADLSPDFDWFLDESIHPELYDDPDEDEEHLLKSDTCFSSFEKKLKADILAYNAQADLSLLRIPQNFCAFIVYNGKSIGINKSTAELDLYPSEKALIDILTKYSDAALERKRKAEQKRFEDEDKVRTLLLNDPHFLACTNKSLRQDFAQELWIKSDSDWIRKLFKSPYSRSLNFPSKDFLSFIERVYKESKYMKYMKF